MCSKPLFSIWKLVVMFIFTVSNSGRIGDDLYVYGCNNMYRAGVDVNPSSFDLRLSSCTNDSQVITVPMKYFPPNDIDLTNYNFYASCMTRAQYFLVLEDSTLRDGGVSILTFGEIFVQQLRVNTSRGLIYDIFDPISTDERIESIKCGHFSMIIMTNQKRMFGMGSNVYPAIPIDDDILDPQKDALEKLQVVYPGHDTDPYGVFFYNVQFLTTVLVLSDRVSMFISGVNSYRLFGSAVYDKNTQSKVMLAIAPESFSKDCCAGGYRNHPGGAYSFIEKVWHHDLAIFVLFESGNLYGWGRKMLLMVENVEHDFKVFQETPLLLDLYNQHSDIKRDRHLLIDIKCSPLATTHTEAENWVHCGILAEDSTTNTRWVYTWGLDAWAFPYVLSHGFSIDQLKYNFEGMMGRTVVNDKNPGLDDWNFPKEINRGDIPVGEKIMFYTIAVSGSLYVTETGKVYSHGSNYNYMMFGWPQVTFRTTPIQILETFSDSISFVGDQADTFYFFTSPETCFGKLLSDPSVCSNHGFCDNSICRCEVGFTGSQCETTFQCHGVSEDSSDVCSGNGFCLLPFSNSTNPECRCHEGYFGEQCDQFTCRELEVDDENVCSSVGTCEKYNDCVCEKNYGANCDEIIAQIGVYTPSKREIQIDYECDIFYLTKNSMMEEEEFDCSRITANSSLLVNGKCHFIVLENDEKSTFLVMTSSIAIPLRTGDSIMLLPVTEVRLDYVVVEIETENQLSASAIIAIVVVLVVVFLCCVFCVLIGVFVTIRICMNRRKIKKFELIDDFEVLLASQIADQRNDIAHLRMQKENFIVDSRDVEVQNKVGKTDRYVIFKAIWNMKPILYQKFNKGVDILTIQKEVEKHASIAHPFCLQFFGICSEEANNGLLLEFPDCTFKEYLVKQRKELSPLDFSYEIGKKLFEISTAMSHIHSLNILHNSLNSSESVFISSSHAKVGGFSYSGTVEDTLKNFEYIPTTDSYSSPEIKTKSESITLKSDVFSFGILCLESYCPKVQLSNIQYPLSGNVFDELEENVKFLWVKDLIQRCCCDLPEKRPSFDEICQVFKKEMKINESKKPRKRVKNIDSKIKEEKEKLRQKDDELHKKERVLLRKTKEIMFIQNEIVRTIAVIESMEN